MHLRKIAGAFPAAFFLSTTLGLFLFSAVAEAEPTEITVHVISKGAKFVGTSMGGVKIVINDAETGALLASGVTAGSTGDTKIIMDDAHKRGAALSDPKAAKFTATLDLDVPRLIKVSAFGPLAQRQSAMTVSSTQWVVPGKHISGGDGWLLELPGFVVDVLNPPAHVKLKGAPQKIALKANVTMMCGCPIAPKGKWDANNYEVSARLVRNGKMTETIPLAFAGQTSQFAAEFEIKEPGVYEADVYAYDPATGNTGLDKVTFIVAAK